MEEIIEQKVKKTRKKRAKKGTGDKMYFTATTQEAILKYVKSTNQVERNRLYKDHIDYAFNKLAEILIHKGKFYYAGPNMGEIKSSVFEHLLEKLNNYDETKGRAYSYFTVIVWRFLINLNNTNYAKLKNRVSDISYHTDTENEQFAYDEQASIEKSTFLEEFIIYLDNNLARIFPRKKDLDIANAILEILRRRHNIENFNKKALYIYIREMTNCKSSHITSIVGAFKITYAKAWNDFADNGCLINSKLYK